MTSSPAISASTSAAFRAAIVFLAPAIQLFAHAYHPWIGSPKDAGFFARIAAVIEADPVRWTVSHIGIAVGSGLLIVAFLAIRTELRALDEQRWSVLGLPFIVMGGVLYAMLPAMELGTLAASVAGEDAAEVQATMMRWFMPILLSGSVLFAIGVAGFAIGIGRSRIVGQPGTWVVVGALVVLAVTRFFPPGAAQIYVGPLVGVVALWPLAYRIWKPLERNEGRLRPVLAT